MMMTILKSMMILLGTMKLINKNPRNNHQMKVVSKWMVTISLLMINPEQSQKEKIPIQRSQSNKKRAWFSSTTIYLQRLPRK